MKAIVVGSGPSGVACAEALLEAGWSVDLLDIGFEQDPATAALKSAMGAVDSLHWTEGQRQQARRGMLAGTGGVAVKRIFGSDFPYRRPEDPRVTDDITGGLAPSSSIGGFSKVWGAAALPFRTEDMTGWPFTRDALDDDYRAVLRSTGLAAEQDDLATDLPLFTETPEALSGSAQANFLLARWSQRPERLRRGGIRVGRSRLMVRGGGSPEGCRLCAHCLYGCPYDRIYDAAQTVARLAEQPAFRYRRGVKVRRVSEEGGRASASTFDLRTGTEEIHSADRVFLAAGVIRTAEIVLRSLGRFGQGLRACDSQYYVVPMLGLGGPRNPRGEALHTLAQLFLELQVPKLSPYLIHLQLYTYNPLMSDLLDARTSRLGAAGRRLVQRFERHAYFLQGYLHSEHSSSLAITLQRRAGGGERLEVRPVVRKDAGERVRSVLRHLGRHGPALGLLPVFPLLQVTAPGRGFHSGGTMPMGGGPAAPGKIPTDELGRPAGWRRIHVADASVFPSIPATTITLTAMANARRIGRLAAREAN